MSHQVRHWVGPGWERTRQAARNAWNKHTARTQVPVLHRHGTQQPDDPQLLVHQLQPVGPGAEVVVRGRAECKLVQEAF